MRVSSASIAVLAVSTVLAIQGIAGSATPEQTPQPHHQRTHAAAPAATPSPGLQYRSIGPALSGGRVAAVAGSDRDAMLYYAGAAGGGVFKSANGGISWQAVWNKQPFGAIGALAISPRNDNDVWAGTGEGNPRNDVSWGDGIWRTTDGAKTWQHLGLVRTSQISRISISPDNPNDVVVAALGSPWIDTTERGIFRTTDGGKSWTKTLYLGPSSGGADLARDPHNPRVLYTAMWNFRREPWHFRSGGPGDGLYKSTDRGATWHEVRGHGFPAGPLGRIGIGIAPSRPQRVYAVVQAKHGTVWRSDDAGATWLQVSADTIPEQRPFYFSHIEVDPRNPKRVISVSMYLSESKDGGRKWAHLTGSVHVDNHALWWSSDGKRLINGNDGGIALSNDGGKSWQMPLDLAIGQIYHVSYSSGDPYEVCGGFQDNFSWCGPSDSRNGTGVIERDWTSIAGGDGTWAVFDPANPDRIWTDTQNGALSIFDRHAQQSIDVEPWPRDSFTSLAGLSGSRYRFNWASPLAFSPEDPHVAYFGGNVVFKTTDSGKTWTPISGDLTRNEKEHQQISGGPISYDVSGAENYDTLLVITPSSTDEKTIWAASDDGLVHVTHDAGTSWSDVTPKQMPRYGRVESIDLLSSDPRTAYIAVDRHDLGDLEPYLFVTNDGGASWRRIDAPLPRNASTHVLRVDPRQPDLLYAGTENGVWYSSDNGERWLPLQFNLPNVPVFDLKVQPQANDLIVATHGRSFWILDDLTPVQQAARVGRGPYLFPLRAGTQWAQWTPLETGDGNSLPANYFVGANPQGPALLTFWQSAPAKSRPQIEVVAANGKVVRHLAGSYKTEEGTKYWVTNAAGYNRLAWDGTEDGPVRWFGTSVGNMGPLTGAQALPGDYTIRLTVDGTTIAQPFVLNGDPRSPFTAADLAERHGYLERTYAAIGEVNALLNEIDRQERALRKRRDAAAMQRVAALDGVRDQLTANDLHDEDGTGRPDRIREQLFSLTFPLGGSFQPPFASHTAAADAVFGEYARIIAQAKATVVR